MVLIIAIVGIQTPAQTNSGIIEGRAFNSVTQEPIANAQISLMATATNPSPTGGAAGGQASAVTDNEGRFRFTNLLPGRYTLRATRDGYFGPTVNGIAPAAVAKTVTVAAGTTSVADIALIQGGVISGRVFSPNGQAVSDANVHAYRVTYGNGRKRWFSAAAKTTNDRGEYRIAWLAPGEYYVGVTPNLGVTPQNPGGLPGPQDTWAQTFFPDVTETEAARALVIQGGTEAAVDIHMRTSTKGLFKISGVVNNPYIGPNAQGVDTSVMSFWIVAESGLLDDTSPSAMNVLPLEARKNGEFEIRNIRPGVYDLVPFWVDPATSAAPLAQRRYLSGRNTVEVRDSDVTGLKLSIAPGFALAGQVTVTNPGPQPSRLDALRFTLRPLSRMPSIFSAAVGTISPDASGTFSLSDVPPDRYGLNVVSLPEGYFVADIRQGTTSVFDEGFVMDGKSSVLQIIVDGGGVQVTGTVLNTARDRNSAATVVLVPPPSRRQNPLLYRNVQSDENGRFTLRSVPPGQYTIYAWERVLTMAWQNAAFLRDYEGRGRELTVEHQSVSGVEVPIIPAETRR